jgi:hypothetical protein
MVVFIIYGKTQLGVNKKSAKKIKFFCFLECCRFCHPAYNTLYLSLIKGGIFMWRAYLQHQPRAKRSGSAFLGLIVVILLVAIVFGVQWYLKKTAKDPDTCDSLTPWKEWQLRDSSQKPQKEPSEEQPKITEDLEYDSNLRIKGGDEPRGDIHFLIKPVGAVFGDWNGTYHKDLTTSFQILSGGFEGRVYPAKIYRDENGKEDPSQLYFLAKGNFLVQETNPDKGTVFNRVGQIYIRGWISPEYASTGEITITSDEKYFETFTWKTYKPVSQKPAGPRFRGIPLPEMK